MHSPLVKHAGLACCRRRGQEVTEEKLQARLDHLVADFASLYAVASSLLRRDFLEARENLAFQLIEVENRTWQLHTLIVRIRDIEAYELSRLSASPIGSIPDHRPFSDGFREIQLLTECFYLIAFRLMNLSRWIPGMEFEARGVQLVRNHLIAHPETHIGAPSPGFAAGGENGPILRIRPRGKFNDQFHDEGLWANAAEFVSRCREAVNHFEGI